MESKLGKYIVLSTSLILLLIPIIILVIGLLKSELILSISLLLSLIVGSFGVRLSINWGAPHQLEPEHNEDPEAVLYI